VRRKGEGVRACLKGEREGGSERARRTAVRGALGRAEVEAGLDTALGVGVLTREDALAVDDEVGVACGRGETGSRSGREGKKERRRGRTALIGVVAVARQLLIADGLDPRDLRGGERQ